MEFEEGSPESENIEHSEKKPERQGHINYVEYSVEELN